MYYSVHMFFIVVYTCTLNTTVIVKFPFRFHFLFLIALLQFSDKEASTPLIDDGPYVLSFGAFEMSTIIDGLFYGFSYNCSVSVVRIGI